jgi:hypothetical protein
MEEPKEQFAFTIYLTLTGKTAVFIQSWCSRELREMLAEKFVEFLGEPEKVCFVKETGNLCMIWPHQNMPQILKDIAEDMTTEALLELAGINWEL